MLDNALKVVQFLYYFGLCLAGVLAVLSFFIGPMLIKIAAWAGGIAISSCFLALLMLGLQHVRNSHRNGPGRETGSNS